MEHAVNKLLKKIHTYIHTYTHTHTHTHTHIYTHTYIHTCVHIHIHTYTYIHTHTHTHTYNLNPKTCIKSYCCIHVISFLYISETYGLILAALIQSKTYLFRFTIIQICVFIDCVLVDRYCTGTTGVTHIKTLLYRQDGSDTNQDLTVQTRRE